MITEEKTIEVTFWTLQSRWKSDNGLVHPRELILNWQWAQQRGNLLYTADRLQAQKLAPDIFGNGVGEQITVWVKSKGLLENVCKWIHLSVTSPLLSSQKMTMKQQVSGLGPLGTIEGSKDLLVKTEGVSKSSRTKIYDVSAFCFLLDPRTLEVRIIPSSQDPKVRVAQEKMMKNFGIHPKNYNESSTLLFLCVTHAHIQLPKSFLDL